MFRTLQGFSTGAQGRMYDGCSGCPYTHYKQFYDYYGSFTYADDWALAALHGTTLTYGAPASVSFNFGTASNWARREAIKKGTAYMHVWMYAIREFEDAIDDCVSCVANCDGFSANDGDSVHDWDEGVAFYTGSLEGTVQGGNMAGKLVYRLAEKRCGNFGTCTGAGGMSQVNDALFKAGGLFPQGRDLLHAGSCSSVRAVVDQIVSLMTVPLVQGTLRYAWKVGQTGGVDNRPSDQFAKNAASGSTYAAAVLPLVHACNPAAASVVSDNVKFGAAVYDQTTGAYVSGTKPDTGAVKAALETTYACLGITCGQVGGLLNGARTAAEAGMEVCTPACSGTGGNNECAAGTHCVCEGRRRHLLFASVGQRCRCH
jgi:Notch-like protein